MVCHVYVWYDLHRPFYVGIGGDARLKSSKRNKRATNRRKDAETRGTFRQEVVLTGSRTSCEEVEKLLIFTYGSVAYGGILFNFTKGGDGGDTFSAQPPERKEEITRKIKESQDPEVRSQCGKLGGPLAALTNKERGNGPWNPGWVQKGAEASLKSRKENPERWEEISRKGAENSWAGEAGARHREVNAAACSDTGKKNKGSRTITNGVVEKKLFPGEVMPGGYYYGRLKRKWINNGLEEKQCLFSDPLPEGFTTGRLPR